MREKVLLYGPNGLTLELNPAEICLDDPGAGTPALVRLKGRTASFECANNEGEVEDIQLNAKMVDWLAAQQDKVDEMWDKAREDS